MTKFMIDGRIYSESPRNVSMAISYVDISGWNGSRVVRMLDNS